MIESAPKLAILGQFELALIGINNTFSLTEKHTFLGIVKLFM